MGNLRLQLNDYRLTTAKIIYRMPDYPSVLQEFIWQNLDRAPDYPELRRFLDFWSATLDGPLHSVKVASVELITPGDFRHFDGDLVLH